MQSIHLREYDIHIGNIWIALSDFLKKRNYSKVAVVVDENTKRYCLPDFLKNNPYFQFLIIEISSGEQHKNLVTCQIIWEKMMTAGMNRNALIINLGGGVIGDMGGFSASTFKRGMDFLQIPTTLLSQVDASIGGKLGVDFMQVKNSIGLFRNPQVVFIDPAFLQTLPFAEIRSGFAEIIKHTLINSRADWNTLQQIKDLKNVDWISYLAPSLKIKKRIVEEDPYEKGIRKALNFGHTIGHAIEGWALETTKPLLHGEAVAIGMICESWLAHKVIGLPINDVQEIANFILSIYEPYLLDETVYSAFIQLMKKDKKNENEAINFTFIDSIGNAVINQTCKPDLIIESLNFYTNCLLKL